MPSAFNFPPIGLVSVPTAPVIVNVLLYSAPALLAVTVILFHVSAACFAAFASVSAITSVAAPTSFVVKSLFTLTLIFPTASDGVPLTPLINASKSLCVIFVFSANVIVSVWLAAPVPHSALEAVTPSFVAICTL